MVCFRLAHWQQTPKQLWSQNKKSSAMEQHIGLQSNAYDLLQVDWEMIQTDWSILQKVQMVACENVLLSSWRALPLTMYNYHVITYLQHNSH